MVTSVTENHDFNHELKEKIYRKYPDISHLKVIINDHIDLKHIHLIQYKTGVIRYVVMPPFIRQQHFWFQVTFVRMLVE